MADSNLIDLVGDVLRNRKSVSSPMYSDALLQLLVDLNVPEDFIRNKNRLAQFRSLKTFNEPILSRKLDILKRRREKSMKSKVKKSKSLQAYRWSKV